MLTLAPNLKLPTDYVTWKAAIIGRTGTEAYPEVIDRASLDDATNYKRSSRDAYLQRLRAKQLIEEPAGGEVRASETLF